MHAAIELLLETVFSTLSVQEDYKEDSWGDPVSSRVDAGWITSTVTVRDIGGDEKGTQCLGYNWATLFLGYINTGTRSSRLGSLEFEAVKCGYEFRGNRT
jgi:hypothetical protein